MEPAYSVDLLHDLTVRGRTAPPRPGDLKYSFLCYNHSAMTRTPDDIPELVKQRNAVRAEARLLLLDTAQETLRLTGSSKTDGVRKFLPATAPPLRASVGRQ